MPVTDPNVVDFNQVIPQIYAYNYYSLASIALLYYDYLITLPDEVQHFWFKRPTAVTICFFLNRYLNLLGNVPFILQGLVPWSDEVCTSFQTYNQIFVVVSQVIVGAILCMRTYALYERKRSVLWSMVFAVLAALGLAAWSIVGLSSDTQFTLSCQPLLSEHDGIQLALSWSGLLLFDSFIFALTLCKAIRIWKMGSGRLSVLLIRDGSLFYLIMALANLSNILTSIYAPFVLKGISITFANVIAVIMITRLMINIQDPMLFATSSRGVATGSQPVSTLGPFVTTVPPDQGLFTDTFLTSGMGVSSTDSSSRTRVPLPRSYQPPWSSGSDAGLSTSSIFGLSVMEANDV